MNAIAADHHLTHFEFAFYMHFSPGGAMAARNQSSSRACNHLRKNPGQQFIPPTCLSGMPPPRCTDLHSHRCSPFILAGHNCRRLFSKAFTTESTSRHYFCLQPGVWAHTRTAWYRGLGPSHLWLELLSHDTPFTQNGVFEHHHNCETRPAGHQ